MSVSPPMLPSGSWPSAAAAARGWRADPTSSTAWLPPSFWKPGSRSGPMTELANVDTLIERLAQQLPPLIRQRRMERPVMIGIHTGGAWIAERLHEMLQIEEPLGTLDISFYRDDFSRIGMNPQVRPSRLPFDVDDRHVILIDDVIYTGRTVRAALNEIFDWGRPASVL